MEKQILTVRIESLESMGKSVLNAVKLGKAEASTGLSFASYEEMHRTLTPKRLAIIRVMASKGSLSYREIARRVGRDIKGVHTDLTTLIATGVIDRTEDGVIFPYQSLHFDFDIQASAA